MEHNLPHLFDLVKLPVTALTISQPYASLIAVGEKWVENRTWEVGFRGVLAIHAGKGTHYLTRSQLQDYHAGGVVAVAELLACVHISGVLDHRVYIQGEHTAQELAEHKHTEGPWCWILCSVRRCQFFPCRGHQGLWRLSKEVPG